MTSNNLFRILFSLCYSIRLFSRLLCHKTVNSLFTLEHFLRFRFSDEHFYLDRVKPTNCQLLRQTIGDSYRLNSTVYTVHTD